MNRVFCAVALTFGLATLVVLPIANADTVTLDSDAFSFGFSASVTGANCWSLESPSTSYMQGDFNVTPAPVGGYFSGTGPTFPGRVLTGGGGGGVSGDIDGFSVPITASYAGAVPAGATNVQLKFEITNISVWGVANNGGSTSLAWNEATSGHSQASSPITLTETNYTNFGVLSNLNQLAWDPADYYVSLATAETPVTRTFNLGTSTGDGLDGLEVMGVVHLSYETVPEPSTLALVATGLVGLLAYAWKKRR